MTYMIHFLFILGISFNDFNAFAADNEALAIDRFLEKDLSILATHYPSKHWVEDPTYAGTSGMYAAAAPNYPKTPRVHSYDHYKQETYFNLQLPQEILNFVQQEDLTQIFKGHSIPKENIRVFFMAQNNLNENILFRPHYFTDPTITTAQYTRSTSVNVGIFPIAGVPLTLASTPDSLVASGISSHPGQGGIIASPSNFQINGLDMYAESIFYSVTIIPAQKKAALTFHYLVGEIPTDIFLCTVDAATKIRHLIQLPLFDGMFDSSFSRFIFMLANRANPESI